MRAVVLFILLIQTSLASTSQEVLIRGKIGSNFDEKNVTVVDSLGQVYRLPRALFPASFRFKQGKSFSIEVHEDQLNHLKITQP
jgi:hypothetical protein